MDSCIFCKVAKKEMPAKIVTETDDYVVFHDIHPQAPVHVLLIPKDHIVSLAVMKDPALLGRLTDGCRTVASDLGLDEKGYRVVTNIGNHGGQTVFHLHFHILGGRHLGWPPG